MSSTPYWWEAAPPVERAGTRAVAQLEPLARDHVTGHAAVDDDRSTGDLCIHHRVLANDQRILR